MTVAEKIEIAQASQFLAANDIAKGGLYGGGISARLPRLLYMIRKNVERLYGLDPSDSTLTKTSNYMYSLCAPFSLRAQAILGGGGTIASVVPVSATSVFPIYITQANFTTATDYNDTRIVGQNLMIFYNEINRYLIPGTEWSYTATGVSITLPGFDATDPSASMNLMIEKVTAGASAGGAGDSVLISTYYGDTDYYSDLISNNDNVPYNGTSPGIIGNPMSATFAAGASHADGKYLVFKVASSMNNKSSWNNIGSFGNSGNIPDGVFREPISFGGNDYYCTRIAYVFDPSFLTMVLT